MLPVAHKGASCVGKLARLKLGRCQKIPTIVAELVTSKNRCHPRGDRRSAGVGLYPPTFGVVANMVGKILIISASVTGGGDDHHHRHENPHQSKNAGKDCSRPRWRGGEEGEVRVWQLSSHLRRPSQRNLILPAGSPAAPSWCGIWPNPQQ